MNSQAPITLQRYFLETHPSSSSAENILKIRSSVGTNDFVEALSASPEWEIEVNERRERPAGAVSAHHVHDVVLRARRVG